MTKKISSGLFILLFLMASLASAAPDNGKSTVSPLAAKACSVIKENIKKGEDIKKFVKVSIQIGHNPCYIVKCGIEGGGNLEQIITGAVEGGATPDVISRCAIDAGAKVFDVASIIMRADSPSICFYEPQEEFIPIETGIPGDIGDGIPVSPWSFRK